MTSDEFVGTKNLYTDDSPIIHVGNVEWPKRGTPAKTLKVQNLPTMDPIPI